MEEINLKEIKEYFKEKEKYILFLLITFLLIGFIFMFSQNAKEYNSNAVLQVTKSLNLDETLKGNLELDSKSIIPTYIEIIKSRNMLTEVKEKLDIDYTQSQLLKMINVVTISNTELIKINVKSIVSQTEASDIANTMASLFQKQRNESNDNFRVEIIEYATKDVEKIDNSILIPILLIVIVSTILPFCILFLLYIFDDKIKSKPDIVNKAKMEILETLFVKKNPQNNPYYYNTNLKNTEKIKIIRKKLLSNIPKNKKISFLITSSGKDLLNAEFALNLSTSFAQLNKKVVLIDVLNYETNPKINDLINISNKYGLFDLLNEEKLKLTDVINKTKINNLNVISFGINKESTSELLYNNLDKFVKEAEEIYDIIVFVSNNPLFHSSTLNISEKVDKTLILVDYRRNTLDSLIEIEKTLSNIGSNPSGVILNDFSQK